MYFYAVEQGNQLLGYNDVFDRTQTLLCNSKVKFLRDIGVYSNLSFTDLCDKRAKEIVKYAIENNKEIFVLWSGGIDSTVVLMSLLNYFDSKYIKILLTKKSIHEYPYLYDKLVKHMAVKFIDDDFILGIKDSLLNGLVVTGEIADQLFGTENYFRYENRLLDRWETLVDKKFIPLLEPYVLKSFQNIITVKDFLWWNNYALKYHHVSFRIPIHIDGAILDKNIVHFFDTKEWNDWSISTPTEEKFFGVNFKNYKKISKDYIYKHFKDPEYRDNKIKTPSLDIYKIPIKYNKIDTDWNWL